MNRSNPCVLGRAQVLALLPQIDVVEALRHMFIDLATGDAIQPPQQLTVFPHDVGDFINYLGVMSKPGIYGIKTSPYLVQKPQAIVTAWTLLMSMQTGQPLLLADAAQLTVERTAATTALAVEQLARLKARKLAVIGLGQIGLAHIRYTRFLREWDVITGYALNVSQLGAEHKQSIQSLDSRIEFCSSLEEAVNGADVVMLCTSSGKPVISLADLNKPALITSISTNVFQAHEISPSELGEMDVYCDYSKTTPAAAGEMVLAAAQYGWNSEHIRGDLPGLLTQTVSLPTYDKHVFFRSIGLGLEDVAIAIELLGKLTQN